MNYMLIGLLIRVMHSFNVISYIIIIYIHVILYYCRRINYNLPKFVNQSCSARIDLKTGNKFFINIKFGKIHIITKLTPFRITA